jgi:hypothetical protein
MSGARRTHGEGKCINLWTENLKERNNFESVVVFERIIFKWIIKNGWGWTDLIIIRIWTIGGMLKRWQCTFSFVKMQGTFY